MNGLRSTLNTKNYVDAIKSFRMRRGYSIAQAAKKAGLTFDAVHVLELGGGKPEDLFKLLEAYNINLIVEFK